MAPDIPKSCPIFPFFRDREGNEFPRDCIGERCQWWWKCREPEPFTMAWTSVIEGADPARISPEEVNEAIQKFEAKISTARR